MKKKSKTEYTKQEANAFYMQTLREAAFNQAEQVTELETLIAGLQDRLTRAKAERARLDNLIAKHQKAGLA